MPFAALGLGPKILKSIKEAGYEEPTPIQTRAIPVVLEGRDVVGIAQTGTGKTAAFVLPMLQKLAAAPRRRNMRALVVAPTRELALQIDENVRAYARHLGDLRFTTIFGGVGEQPQIDALRRGVDLVVATPGRLMDLMARRFVRFDDIEFVVLDEADRMLDMGFLPSIRKIIAALPTKRQTLLFSATLSKEIESIARDFLRDPAMVQIGARSAPTELVTQYVIEVGKEAKNDMLVHLLKDAKLETVLVFSRTKHGADKIARKLVAAGISTATLHANRTQGQRVLALKKFRSGEVRVLVATDIAARGIDVDGISHVVNFDFPPQPEDYVHRIGRTGRAHAIGDALSFVTPDDAKNLHQVERFLGRGIPRMKVEGFVASLAPAYVPSRAASPQHRLPQRPAGQPTRPSGGHGSGRPQASASGSSHGTRSQRQGGNGRDADQRGTSSSGWSRGGSRPSGSPQGGSPRRGR